MDRKKVIDQAKEIYNEIVPNSSMGDQSGPQKVLAILAIARFLSEKDGDNKATGSDKRGEV